MAKKKIKFIEEWIGYNPDTGDLYWLQSPRYGIERGDTVGWLDRKGYIRFKFNRENISATALIAFRLIYHKGFANNGRW